VNTKSLLSVSLRVMILSFLLSSVLYCGMVRADTNVSGIITSDTTWTKSNSPYNLTGNVLIESGVTLTVEADATVNFNEYFIRVNGSLIIQPGVTLDMRTVVGGGSIQVNGLLTARGTGTDPIHVIGGTYYYAWIAPPTYSSIVFSQYSTPWSEQTGSGCIIENVVLNSTYISVNNSPKITENTFLDGGGVTVSGGSPEILNNNISGRIEINGGSPTIANNYIEYGQIFYYSDYSGEGEYVTIIGNVVSHAMGQSSNTAIWLLGGSYGGYGGQAVVERNLIVNSAIGIDVFNPNTDHIGTSISIRNNTIINNTVGLSIMDECTLTITGNNIYDNPTSVRLSQVSTDFDATYNWWGTTDSQAISQSIVDFEDDFDLGKVTFVPFLSEPNPEAPDATYVPTTPPLPAASPTPTIEPSPTIEPTPETTPTPSPEQTTPPTSPTPYEEPQQSDQQVILGVAVTVVVVCVGLGLMVYLIKRK
jgi:hypothetical protein